MLRGVPQDVVYQIPEGQREYLFEMLDDSATFASYNRQNFTQNNDGNLVAPRYGMTSDADLTISVVAFDLADNGNPIAAIFPTFIWNTEVKIDNDAFAMALYPNWEVVPGENNLRIWIRNMYGD